MALCCLDFVFLRPKRGLDFTVGRENCLVNQWYFAELKGSHRSVAYLGFCCLECLIAVLLNDSAAFKVVCEN